MPLPPGRAAGVVRGRAAGVVRGCTAGVVRVRSSFKAASIPSTRLAVAVAAAPMAPKLAWTLPSSSERRCSSLRRRPLILVSIWLVILALRPAHSSRWLLASSGRSKQ